MVSVLPLALVATGVALGLAASPHCALMCGAPWAALTRGRRRDAASFHIARVAGYAAAGAVATVPAALSVGGAVLTVKAVEGSAVGTVYLLERASDGAQVSVEVAGRGVGASAYAVGTVVTCSVIGTGVVLSVAGEAIAFVPNAIGRALLHNERL